MGAADRHTRDSIMLVALIHVACFGSIFHGAAAAATALVGSVTLFGANKYVAAVKLGTPLQTLNLTLDTEAQITTISKSVFDYTTSSTFRPLRLGDLYTDVFTFDSTDGLVPTAALQLNGILFDLLEEDVLGLGIGLLAFPTLVSATTEVAWKFAYCLGGFTAPTPIFFGNISYYFHSGLPGSRHRFPELDVTPHLKYTPLTVSPRDQYGYGVAITSIVVDQATGDGTVEVDDIATIGTKYLYTSIAEPAYTHIRKAFLSVPVVASKFQRLKAHYGPLDLCFNFTGQTGLLRSAPLITFVFQGNSRVALTADNYLVEVDNTDIYCFGLTSAGKERGSSVIGTFQQRDNLVEFDLEGHRLGITGSLVALRSNCGNFNFKAA